MTSTISISLSSPTIVFDSKLRSTFTLSLSDEASEPAAFKIKTTRPNRYTVKPNVGVLTRATPSVVVQLAAVTI